MDIAVVIPCYRVKDHILQVLDGIGPDVTAIFVVDDKCPEGSGALVSEQCLDTRVSVIYNRTNLGVGGAVKAGYRAALAQNMNIIVKLDGDGQMDPGQIPALVYPIVSKRADYTKGNRFYSVWYVRNMPPVRMLGNAFLSFITKLSSGYWSIFDPTNGFTAIHSTALRQINLENVVERYFFESDMLINLGGIRAVVRDVGMEAQYGDEVSGLSVTQSGIEFSWRHLRAIIKRVIYDYFLRDFNIGSLSLVLGCALSFFGAGYGVAAWTNSITTGIPASAGQVMISALPTLVGIQLLLNFVAYDMSGEPLVPLQELLPPTNTG